MYKKIGSSVLTGGFCFPIEMVSLVIWVQGNSKRANVQALKCVADNYRLEEFFFC